MYLAGTPACSIGRRKRSARAIARPALAFATLALAALLAACGGPKTLSTWMEPTASGRPLGRTAVLGVGRDPDMRRAFEETFARHLADAGYDVMPGNRVLPDVRPDNPKTVQSLLVDKKFRTAVVSRLVHPGEAPYAGGTGSHPYPVFLDYFYSAAQQEFLAAQTDVEFTEIETMVYDLEDGQLLWRTSSDLPRSRSPLDDIDKYAGAMSGALKKSGLKP